MNVTSAVNSHALLGLENVT